MAVGTSVFPTSLDTVVELIEAANNSTTTLDGALNDSATTIPVVSTASFPSSGTISIDSEIISYTGKTGASFTGCTRGFESTSAASHSNGATVDGEITARHHNVLASALIAVQTKLGTGSTIAYSKLNLTGSITNADLAGSIALSKLSITGTPDGTKFLRDDGSWQAVAGGGSGTVTSVGLSLPGMFTVTNSPVTTAGTLTATLADQAANKVFAGPTTGAATTPTFRSLVSGDIPDLSSTYAAAGHTHSTLTSLYLNGTAGAGYLEMRPQSAAPAAPAAGFALYADSTGRFSWIRASDGFIRKWDASLTADRIYTLPDVSGTVITTGNLTGITATGTIASGTWNGSVIGASYGGAGTVTGILKANGSGTVSAASSGSDYEVPLTFSTGLTRTTNTVTVNTTQNISKLSNLTSNGFVKTSSGDGTLSVDTSTYLTANQSITLSGDVTGSGSTAITTTIASASVTYAKIQNISATSRILGRKTAAAGSTEECTLSDVLDFVGSAAQGDILYRGASGWARLGAGTSGHYLQTQGAAANPQWAAAAGGGLTIGTTAITSGTAGRVLYETAGNVVGEIAGSSVDANGAIQWAATARTSGVAQYFRINTPADTGQTTATESVGAYFGGNGSGSTVTRTWANGNITTQRENVFVAPTYAFVSGSNTITTAATVAITGAPVAGGFATITASVGVWDQSGKTLSGDAAQSTINGTSKWIQLADTASIANATLGTGTVSVLELVRSTSKFMIYTDAATTYLGTNSAHSLIFRSSNLNRGQIDSSGLWSIGSNHASSAQLHVVSQSSSRVALRADSAASPSVDIVQFTNNGTNNYQFAAGGPLTIAADTSSADRQAIKIVNNPATNIASIAFIRGASTLNGWIFQNSTTFNMRAEEGVLRLQAFTDLQLQPGFTTTLLVASGGAITQTATVANTNTVATVHTINANSTTSAAAGFGAQMLYQLESTTTDSQSAASIAALWTTATHASRTSALTFSTVNNAGSLTEIARFSGVAAVFAKGMVFAYVAKTGTYTAAVTDYVIDCTSGTFTVNLPPVSGLAGQTFIIKNSGTGTITVDGDGSETIDGATTQTISSGASVVVMCTGTAWIIL